MTYIPDMIELEPPIGPPGPTAEELQAYADRERESLLVWKLYGPAYYEDCYNLYQSLWTMICNQVKEELAIEHPDWVLANPELFKAR